jgi:hypothetical protein
MQPLPASNDLLPSLDLGAEFPAKKARCQPQIGPSSALPSAALHGVACKFYQFQMIGDLRSLDAAPSVWCPRGLSAASDAGGGIAHAPARR